MVEEKVSSLQLKVALLERECSILRRDHEKSDIKLSRAYSEMSKSLTTMSQDFRMIKRVVLFSTLTFLIGYGAINWQDFLKLSGM